MKYGSTITSGILALSLLTGITFGQEKTTATKDTLVNAEDFETLKGQVESLNESFLTTKATVDKLAKIKVSGYIQGQWQHADTNGAAAGAFAGGAFPANSNQRLQLRRVRLKTTYDNVTSQYVMEFEARPSGVALKDAEVILNEPWLKTFSLALGLMDRPFGFEIPYSSSAHEAPERTRMYQTLFKDEKDVGVKLEANPTERMGLAQYFNAKVGLYTGTSGYNGGTGDEIDSTVDIIGRVGFKLPVYSLNLAIDGGFSYYGGKSLSLNDSAYAISGDTAMLLTTGNLRHTFDRQVFGIDMQAYYTIPVIGDLIGGSSLRGEYLWGNTPGTSSASGPYGASTGPLYDRNFMGWYVSWIQNYGNKFQSVVKYDVYDPNTDVTGAAITGASIRKLGAQDLKYTTLGLGAIYYWDEVVRLTVYYDKITNETVNGAATGASLAAYKSDLKDNIFTARVQVKF